MPTFLKTPLGLLLSIIALITAIGFIGWIVTAEAKAADLGGACCADLEERIAELEATTARKGNKKVSLTISGVVNQGIIGWTDGLLGDSDVSVQPNGINPTRVTFVGDAKIAQGWKAGFIIELAQGQWDVLSGALGIDDGIDVYTRQAAVFIQSPAGRVTVGKTNQASYWANSVSTANLRDSDEMLSLCPVLGCSNLTQNLDIYNGQFLDVVRYDSPLMAGFIVSASWSRDGTNNIFTGTTTPQDVWDVALRYAGEFNAQWRVAAAVAYRNGAVFQGLTPILPFPVIAFDQTTAVASGSVMYMPMGIFVDGAVGQADFSGVGFGGLGKITSWEVRPGVEQRLSKLGKTTVYASFMELKIDGVTGAPRVYGLGAVQAIDAAAANLYARWNHWDTDGLTTSPADVFMAGMALHF